MGSYLKNRLSKSMFVSPMYYLDYNIKGGVLLFRIHVIEDIKSIKKNNWTTEIISLRVDNNLANNMVVAIKRLKSKYDLVGLDANYMVNKLFYVENISRGADDEDN